MFHKDNDNHRPTTEVYQSGVDGAWVIHIDTHEEMLCDETGPYPLRVHINDGDAIYVNPDLPEQS